MADKVFITVFFSNGSAAGYVNMDKMNAANLIKLGSENDGLIDLQPESGTAGKVIVANLKTATRVEQRG